jgi:hypothetical protein
METRIASACRRSGRSLRRGTVALVLGVTALAVVAGTATATGTAKKPVLKGTALKPTKVVDVDKAQTSRVAKTDPTLLGKSSSAPVHVMIKYDFDATASYTGGVDGLAPTSPRETGRKLRENRGAVGAYEAFARQKAQSISSAIKNAVPGANVKETFETVYGGVRATIPANAVEKVLSVPGVVAVQRDAVNHPTELSGAEPRFIGATNAWNSLGGEKAGDGVVVGVIDTGIWPEHPSVAARPDLSPSPGSYPCQFGVSGSPNDPAFACNNKLIGAYAFTDTYMAVVGAGPEEYCNASTNQCSARDSEGHGTHTATTAAGNPVASAQLFGVERGPVSGVAPGAKLIMYRVCLSGGCYSSDSISAIQQAILDGVDVINFSISGGNDPYTDSVELAFLDAFNAGISVNASAGNEGPGPATVAHASPWVTSVGASTSDRFFTSTLHLQDGVAVFDKQGVTVTDGIDATPVVLSSTWGDSLCQNVPPPGAASGKIVACERGVNGRIQKGYNVMLGGGVGLILYNPTRLDVETDNHFIPGIHLEGPNDDLVAFITAHPAATASWPSSTATETQGDVMAAFSSRGPAPDFVKPDVTAPGIQVLAGMTPKPTPAPAGVDSGAPDQLWQAIAGTSMSGPHAAGASALVKAAHEDWSPAEIKSALMTSSVQDVVKEDGTTTADPFDMGAGSIRVDRAINPTVVLDETYANYVASAADPLGRINLNLPSIDAPTMPGTVMTTRKLTNVTDGSVDLSVAVDAPAGSSISVNGGRDIHIRRGGTTRVRIVISAPGLADGQYFGRITLSPRGGGTPVTLPVAFFRQQGSVSLVNSCSPTTFRRITGSTHCTVAAQNFESAPANVKLVVEGVGHGNALLYSHVHAPSGTLKTPIGFAWKGQLSPALAPEINGVAQSDASNGLYGYNQLSDFGIGPESGYGDETIGTYGVPAFKFGDEVYNQIGVDSNGYVVVGPATSADNVCCDMPPLPDAAAPNNVIAPFWTDLNPAAGGSISVGLLNDGVDDYIVVEWKNVLTYGTTQAQSFQVWIRAGANEGQWLEYAQVTGSGASTNLVVGAENRDGSSGVNVSPIPSAGQEYFVDTGSPTPGGSVTFEYDARSLRDGVYSSVANLTSDVTPGVTQKVQELTVTR